MNKTVIIGVLFIAAVAIFRAVTSKQNNKPTVTRIMLGAFILMLLLSIADFFGPQAERLTNAIVVIAIIFVLLNDMPWQTLVNITQGNTSSTNEPTSPVPGPPTHPTPTLPTP